MIPAYRNVLYKKYKILGHLEFKMFDQDFSILEKYLIKHKKEQYDFNERFIIEHIDTDFYLPDFPYGFNLYNLVYAFQSADIPLFTLLLFTNHFGIKKELDRLVPTESPTVIETFIVSTHWTTNYAPVEVNPDAIEIPAISMVGQNRPHRNTLYHFLKTHNLLDVVALAANPPV